MTFIASCGCRFGSDLCNATLHCCNFHITLPVIGKMSYHALILHVKSSDASPSYVTEQLSPRRPVSWRKWMSESNQNSPIEAGETILPRMCGFSLLHNAKLQIMRVVLFH